MERSAIGPGGGGNIGHIGQPCAAATPPPPCSLAGDTRIKPPVIYRPWLGLARSQLGLGSAWLGLARPGLGHSDGEQYCASYRPLPPSTSRAMTHGAISPQRRHLPPVDGEGVRWWWGSLTAYRRERELVGADRVGDTLVDTRLLVLPTGTCSSIPPTDREHSSALPIRHTPLPLPVCYTQTTAATAAACLPPTQRGALTDR